jgi:hypothetical protein
VVGHGLPTYFLNAVRSACATAPGEPLLIIDNASPSEQLHQDLRRLADEDDHIDVILRSANGLPRNRKVGDLYGAYRIAFEWAIARGFDLLHLLQGDFQMLWWDAELVRKSQEIFASHPRCINIQMQFLSRDKRLTDEWAPPGADGPAKLRKYGLTDTGLYHLGRWQAGSIRFDGAERDHGKRYLGEGLEVLCHPWPTDAPIPWPAVVRSGIQRGREVVTSRPFLLRPLSAEGIARVKEAAGDVWLEDVCVPWGWACATPMWVSDPDSIDYWVLRYRDARQNGLRHLLPRFELRGVRREDHWKLIRDHRYRPSLFRLFVAAPAREGARRLARRAQS